MLRSGAYLVDVLALELADELVEALAVGLDTDRLKNLLDVAGGGRGVAAESEEEVCCEVLHCDVGWLSFRNRSSINLTCCNQYMRRREWGARYAHRSDGD
jgi:hypothetical protein